MQQYKPIRKRKIYEEIADQLKMMIEEGVLKPGDKLDSVQQLADNFNVGRSAVREALSALKAIGLVEMKQGEGTYVCQYDSSVLTHPIANATLITLEDMMQLLEVRKMLELGSVALAAELATEEDLKELGQMLDKMFYEGSSYEMDDHVVSYNDWKFHISIAKASHNQVLVNLMNSISEVMITSVKEIRRIWVKAKPEMAQQLVKQHQHIYNAIASGNPDEAREKMFIHLEYVEAVIKEYFGLKAHVQKR